MFQHKDPDHMMMVADPPFPDVCDKVREIVDGLPDHVGFIGAVTTPIDQNKPNSGLCYVYSFGKCSNDVAVVNTFAAIADFMHHQDLDPLLVLSVKRACKKYSLWTRAKVLFALLGV